MPTKKDRINLSVSPREKLLLETLARRDRVSVASKALELMNMAFEIEEDDMFTAMAAQREKRSQKFLSHNEVWR